MKASVFTPFSPTGEPYLQATFESLQRQRVNGLDGEWVILPNLGAQVPRAIAETPWVRVLPQASEGLGNIGALKRQACAACTGDFLVELDHDDLLREGAISRLAQAFLRGADFAYSDFAEFRANADADADAGPRWLPNVYSSEFGWMTSPEKVELDGSSLIAMRAPPVTPQNLRSVMFSPNHVRAWRRDFYEKIGRHSADFPLADDHDLVVRTYLAGAKITYIPECLYLYRVHPEQATATRNAEIQAWDDKVYDWHFASLAAKAGLIREHDTAQFQTDPVAWMISLWSRSAPGGFVAIEVPSTAGRGAFENPTHKSHWNENSFRYYTDAYAATCLRHPLADQAARFQVSRLRTYYPSDWHKENDIPYVQAHLIALKAGYTPMGHVGI